MKRPFNLLIFSADIDSAIVIIANNHSIIFILKVTHIKSALSGNIGYGNPVP